MKRAYETAPNLGQPDVQENPSVSYPEQPGRSRSLSFGDQLPVDRSGLRSFSFEDFSKAFAKLSVVTDTVIYGMPEDEEDEPTSDALAEPFTDPPSSPPGSPGPKAAHLAGGFKTACTMFKTLVGPGLLFMPAGVRNAGMATAVSMTLTVGFLSIYCVVLLLRTAVQLRTEGHKIYGFGDIGQALFGYKGKMMVNIGICTCQMGFCTAYCVFIAENLQMAIFEIVGCHDLSGFWASQQLVYWIILIVVPLQIPLTWIRQLKYFALTNFLANIIILSTVLYMFICFFAKVAEPSSGHIKAADFTGSLIYVGTAMYAFEGGAAMVLPIERSYADKHKMEFLTVTVMTVVVLLQATFSAAAYWAAPRQAHGLNPGSGTGPVIAVQILWCLAVFLTFPLQLFPAAKIIETIWYPDRRSERKWRKNCIRCAMVLFCMAVSVGGYSSVDNLVSIIGAVGCVPLAIIYPALFYWRMQTRPEGETPGRIFNGALVIVCVGVAGLLVAVTMAIRSWVMSTFEYQTCNFT